VFHVSLIKPYTSDGCTQPPPPPELVDDCPEWLMTALNGQYSKCLTTELLSVDVNAKLNA
jgi:hypothetical protein